MPVRRFVRGRVPDDQLERVAREVTDRYGEELSSVESLDADNWLSTPCVVNDDYFLKVMTTQNSVVHALLTTGRNLGAFSTGREGFFEHFGTPVGMARHERDATRRIRELGVPAPEPLDAFEFEGLGVLVLEYLPDFRPLDALDPAEAAGLAPDLFGSLAVMHDAGIAHGDLRAENVLVSEGELYVIDATKLRPDAVADARSYDVACALAALEPLIGARRAVLAASDHYPDDALLSAESFLDFVNIRPDHRFDAVALKGEIEMSVT
ncbi:MAG: RIO1 family regulatory kinase/ATPase [Salinirussus sp.]